MVECAVVIELKDLKGKAKLNGLPLYVQVQKEGSSLLNSSQMLLDSGWLQSVGKFVKCFMCSLVVSLWLQSAW